MASLPPQLLQFAGSLVAILVLAWIALRLGLGPGPRLECEAHARRAFEEAFPGYMPTEVALDRKGAGAIARDDAGRIFVLRPHGSHFAGRQLTAAARVGEDAGALVIDTAERRFGSARLELADVSRWVQALEDMGVKRHA